MNRKSTYIRIPLNHRNDEERFQIRGILKSLLTSVYQDLEENGTRNYQFFLRERLSTEEKRFLIRSLQKFYDNHKKYEILQENNEIETLPDFLLDRADFYAGGSHD
jgi:type III secretory pathway component EscR